MKTAEAHLLNEEASNYDETAYQRPALTVDVCVCAFTGGEVRALLVKRSFPPFRGKWSLPGTFIQIDRNEGLEKSARRALKEKLKLENEIFLEQLKTYGKPGRDPRTRVITVAYLALLKEAVATPAGTAWFNLGQLPALAFDHNHILADLQVRLAGKIQYAPLAFQLLPDQFTWAQLQSLYETILNKKLLAANFRRKIKKQYHVKELKKTRPTPGAGKPPRLVKYVGQREGFD